VGPRAGLDVAEKKKDSQYPNPFHPIRSQSLYRLSYPRVVWFILDRHESKLNSSTNSE